MLSDSRVAVFERAPASSLHDHDPSASYAPIPHAKGLSSRAQQQLDPSRGTPISAGPGRKRAGNRRPYAARGDSRQTTERRSNNHHQSCCGIRRNVSTTDWHERRAGRARQSKARRAAEGRLRRRPVVVDGRVVGGGDGQDPRPKVQGQARATIHPP
jgi:hypothetical protein